MKRLITGFAVGALALMLFVPQVFAEDGEIASEFQNAPVPFNNTGNNPPGGGLGGGGGGFGGGGGGLGGLLGAGGLGGQNANSVVVKDGKVNGKPVDQYILDEVANGKELSDIVSKLIDGGASAGDVVKAAIKAGINSATAAGVVAKASPKDAKAIVVAATEADFTDARYILQAVINVVPNETQTLKFAVEDVLLSIQNKNGIFGAEVTLLLEDIRDLKPASQS